MDKWSQFSMASDAAEKPPILATGVVSLLPGNAAGTGKWTSCGIFLDHLLLKYVQCTAWYSPIAQFKEMLPSYSTRHHPSCFRNRYACWLNFCKDRGFHPKLRGANSIFFPIKWTLNFLIHFSGQHCNSLTLFTLAYHKNYFAASKV